MLVSGTLTPGLRAAELPPLEDVASDSSAGLRREMHDGLSSGRLEPRPVDDPGGRVETAELLATMPDLVAVWNREGTDIAGYVHQGDMFGEAFARGHIPVYGRDGQTIRGQWVHGKGFIGLDEDPEDVEPFRPQPDG